MVKSVKNSRNNRNSRNSTKGLQKKMNLSKNKSIYKNKKKSSNKKSSNKKNSIKCPPNMDRIKVNNDILCVGRCPHSGGPIYYNPKLDKLVCKWHGSQFSKKGKVLTPPASSNLNIKRM